MIILDHILFLVYYLLSLFTQNTFLWMEIYGLPWMKWTFYADVRLRQNGDSNEVWRTYENLQLYENVAKQ